MHGKKTTPVHDLLGYILDKLLTPLDVTVKTRVRLMAESPEADILLLRREQPRWTEAQRSLLPDGIRDTRADHILIEFKNTESLNRRVLYQALAYRFIYLETQNIKPERLHTVIVSAKSPVSDFRERFNFSAPHQPGVLQSRNIAFEVLQMLVLNELSDAAHNQYIKCFASRKAVRLGAVRRVLSSGVTNISRALVYIFLGLLNLYGEKKKGDPMQEYQLSPETVQELGRRFESEILASLSVEKRLEGLGAEARLSGLRPEERLVGLKPEERLVGLKPEERLVGLKPEERLVGLKLEDILDNLSAEDIISYLEKKRKLKK